MIDIDYMRMALELAKSVKGQTSPNPPVGSVIVKDGRIIGLGAHLKAGEEHAEVQAIKMAGEKAENSTVYVTLEPCSHYGKTPPCADLLIKEKVKRVVIATTDPNPLVAGKGISKLRSAGIEVEVGLLKAEAGQLYEMFFHFIATKTPYVTLKTALTFDGKTASRTGSSKWITGALAREDVHKYRHIHDAILVGVNTVIKDDPSLTTRLSGGDGFNPVRIVLDNQLRTPLQAEIVNDKKADTWIVVSESVSKAEMLPFVSKGIKIIKLEQKSIQIKSVLAKLGELGITSLLVEGGSEVNGSFMKEKKFNQVVSYIAPKLIGGNLAPGFIGGEGIDLMDEAVQLSFKSIELMGEDLKIVAVPDGMEEVIICSQE